MSGSVRARRAGGRARRASARLRPCTSWPRPRAHRRAPRPGPRRPPRVAARQHPRPLGVPPRATVRAPSRSSSRMPWRSSAPARASSPSRATRRSSGSSRCAPPCRSRCSTRSPRRSRRPACRPGPGRLGVLATDGTLLAGTYAAAAAAAGLELLTPSPEVQREVMSIIYDGVKAGSRCRASASTPWSATCATGVPRPWHSAAPSCRCCTRTSASTTPHHRLDRRPGAPRRRACGRPAARVLGSGRRVGRVPEQLREVRGVQRPSADMTCSGMPGHASRMSSSTPRPYVVVDDAHHRALDAVGAWGCRPAPRCGALRAAPGSVRRAPGRRGDYGSRRGGCRAGELGTTGRWPGGGRCSATPVRRSSTSAGSSSTDSRRSMSPVALVASSCRTSRTGWTSTGSTSRPTWWPCAAEAAAAAAGAAPTLSCQAMHEPRPSRGGTERSTSVAAWVSARPGSRTRRRCAGCTTTSSRAAGLVLDNEVPYSGASTWSHWPPGTREDLAAAPSSHRPTAGARRMVTSTPSGRVCSPSTRSVSRRCTRSTPRQWRGRSAGRRGTPPAHGGTCTSAAELVMMLERAGFSDVAGARRVQRPRADSPTTHFLVYVATRA